MPNYTVLGETCELSHNKNIIENIKNCKQPIQTLVLRDEQLGQFPISVFPHLAGVKFVDFTDAKLKSVEHLTFCKQMPSLTSVDLSRNQLTKLPSHLLRDCYQLDQLKIASCQITTLVGDIFADLHSLSVLNLELNQIHSIDDDVFKPLIHLSCLKLNNNQIRVIDTNVFARNENLEILYLSDNLLETIEPEAFWKLKKLETLKLDNNPTLKKIDLTQMDELHSVEMDNTSLTSLHIPLNVRAISVINNKISRITADIDTTIHQLSLKNNSFTQLKDLVSLKEMAYLDLSYNGLTDIDFSCFASMQNLEEINIAGNPLKKINGAALHQHVPSLRSIDISLNVLDEDNKDEFIKEMKKYNIIVKDHMNNGNIFPISIPQSTCQTEPSLNHNPLIRQMADNIRYLKLNISNNIDKCNAIEKANYFWHSLLILLYILLGVRFTNFFLHHYNIHPYKRITNAFHSQQGNELSTINSGNDNDDDEELVNAVG